MTGVEAAVRRPPLFQLILRAALLTALPTVASAKGAPKIHVVASGQRLESIAKRYNVSVPALLRMNGLNLEAIIRPGQRLAIPSSTQEESGPSPASESNAKSVSSDASASRAPATAARPRAAHEERFDDIALRYVNAAEALAVINGVKKRRPAPADEPRAPGDNERMTGASWHRYRKAPKQKGFLELSTPISRFSGVAVDSDGRLFPSTVRAVNALLGAGGAHPRMPERLIRLLVKLSDTFGSRPIRVVSGYRTASYFKDSRHKSSSAVDIIVIGVPNAVVCDYLREFEDVGVGYYPNSSFVHLDVRDHSAYWVDYSGPGEPPRSSPNAPAARPRKEERTLLAELRHLLEDATEAIEHAGPAPARLTRKGSLPELRPPPPPADAMDHASPVPPL